MCDFQIAPLSQKKRKDKNRPNNNNISNACAFSPHSTFYPVHIWACALCAKKKMRVSALRLQCYYYLLLQFLKGSHVGKETVIMKRKKNLLFFFALNFYSFIVFFKGKVKKMINTIHTPTHKIEIFLTMTAVYPHFFNLIAKQKSTCIFFFLGVFK